MGCRIIIFLCVYLAIGCVSLVHYYKAEKGANGCKLNSTELPVWGTAQNPEVCGVWVCQNQKGDTLIHYCQIPARFMRCYYDGVDTTIDFPKCCWICVMYKNCSIS